MDGFCDNPSAPSTTDHPLIPCLNIHGPHPSNKPSSPRIQAAEFRRSCLLRVARFIAAGDISQSGPKSSRIDATGSKQNVLTMLTRRRAGLWECFLSSRPHLAHLRTPHSPCAPELCVPAVQPLTASKYYLTASISQSAALVFNHYRRFHATGLCITLGSIFLCEVAFWGCFMWNTSTGEGGASQTICQTGLRPRAGIPFARSHAPRTIILAPKSQHHSSFRRGKR